jgi:hypothetical protein
MEPKEILSQATTIARDAQAQAQRVQLEETIREAENSEVPVLRSLARTYRMLQRPFY